MSTLRMRFLGEFQVYLDEVPIPFKSQSLESLFAYLVLHRHQAHSRASLASLLWPETSDAQARMNLRHTLYELRKTLGDYLFVGRDQIQFLSQSDSWLDLEEFEQSLQRREKLKDSQEQLRCLEEAVALYRGRFLEGCYDDWVLAEQRRWDDLYLSTLSQLAESYAQFKEFSKAIEQCRRVLEIEPWRENAHRQKMLYHYFVGETSEALDT